MSECERCKVLAEMLEEAATRMKDHIPDFDSQGRDHWIYFLNEVEKELNIDLDLPSY